MSTAPKIVALRSIKLELEPGNYYWCSCGESKNQPFCDGSHAGSNFNPVPFEVTKKELVGYCLCKVSKDPFYRCDGSHKLLKQQE